MACRLQRRLIGSNFRIESFGIIDGFGIKLSQVQPRPLGRASQMLALMPILCPTPAQA